MDPVVEEALIRAFIVPAKRQRYLDKLSSPKARRKFLAEHLYHMGDLDDRYAERLDDRIPLVEHATRRAAHIDAIYELLRGRGAPPPCYVISTGELDGQHGDLHDVLERVVGLFEGTLISCLPGRLAYFEGEGPRERYILERSE
jgi:hypothetical protein